MRPRLEGRNQEPNGTRKVKMRPWMILVAVSVFCAGCTHVALERRTVKQASTLTDLQYKQVLDNLAMFACNPDALPWHVKLKGGTVQIADQGSGGFIADIAGAAGGEVTRLIPSAGASRGVLNQWDVAPTVEAGELEHLRLAYQAVLNPGDEEINSKIYDAICELSVNYRVVLSKDIMEKIIEDKKRRTVAAGNNLDSLWLELQEAYNKLQEISSRFYPIVVKEREQKKDEVPQREKAELDTATQPIRGGVPPLVTKQEQQAENYKEQILRLTGQVCDLNFIPMASTVRAERNVALIDQAQEKIKTLYELTRPENFGAPWFGWGGKKDVPKCACYVGHYCGCPCDCYVWVLPGQEKKLRELLLTILSLAPAGEQDITQAGAAFSPSLR